MKKENRIKKHSEFDLIIKTGKKIKSKIFSVYYLSSSSNSSRIGIAVGKSNGKAVTRVKIKRQIRAILASCWDFSLKVNVIIIARPNYEVGEFSLNKTELVGLLDKIED